MRTTIEDMAHLCTGNTAGFDAAVDKGVKVYNIETWEDNTNCNAGNAERKKHMTMPTAAPAKLERRLAKEAGYRDQLQWLLSSRGAYSFGGCPAYACKCGRHAGMHTYKADKFEESIPCTVDHSEVVCR
ncbi:MAG: hypothetical protein ACLR2O_12520 [Coprococcus sp.]